MTGWVSIQKGSIVAYMSEDGRYLMQGDLIDLDNNVNLSVKTAATRHVAQLMASRRCYNDDVIIAFTPSENVNAIRDDLYGCRLHLLPPVACPD